MRSPGVIPTRYQQSIELIEGSWAAKRPQTLIVANNKNLSNLVRFQVCQQLFDASADFQKANNFAARMSKSSVQAVNYRVAENVGRLNHDHHLPTTTTRAHQPTIRRKGHASAARSGSRR
jgi:hypothetical protein